MPECWRTTTRHDAYEVSNLGRVRNSRNGRILRPARTDRGYWKVSLTRRCQAYVHQLVAEAFHGPGPAGHEVDHIDWNRANNAATNLRWLPRVENAVRWADRVDGRNVWTTPDTPPPAEWTPLDDLELEALQAELAAAGWRS